ncbi:MAG: hypothetical protein PHY08_10550 [Candidatus Cloacimonetes bacterium]|jgi:ABC-type cobalamin/Fe3+-siderophores transport system ATPase subunit|nr:hypothetical protein [Candidatus Cloacimonadota bacterium]
MVNIIDKNMILNNDFEWFKEKIDDGFCINDNKKSKVIFGYNGIGKTTIFNCIKDLANPLIEFLDYFEVKDTIKNSKNTMIISSNINQITSLKSQIEPYNQTLNGQKVLKEAFGFSKQKDLEQFSDKVLKSWKDKSFSGYTVDKKSIQQIEQRLNGIQPRVFIEVLKEVESVISAKNELEDAKKLALHQVLCNLDKITNISDDICPICDSPKPDIKQIIQSKISAFDSKKTTLITKLNEAGVNVNESMIDNLVQASKQFEDNPILLEDFMLCGGSSTVFDTVSETYKNYLEIHDKISKLQKKAEDSYNNILKTKPHLEADLMKYFKVDISKIKYDSSNFTITVTFPYELKKYSTGELNLISFLFRVYSFIGSDKTVLILDDPASSLDLINHYKIAYEIVRNAKDRTLIVLTHSVEFINVVNSQHPLNPSFEFYYLEQLNGKISINEIILQTLNNNPNIISLDKLKDLNEFIGFKDALIEKESSDLNDSIQLLFHYTPDSVYLSGDESKFSNHDLINLIEEFDSFEHHDFYTDSYNKILYLSALRLWLEKKLFLLIPKENNKLQEKFLKADTLIKRIGVLLPKDGESPVQVPEGLTRDILMSKKVMLNQGVHYYSQVMPFAYAINLSLDMLSEEIIEFKNMF